MSKTNKFIIDDLEHFITYLEGYVTSNGDIREAVENYKSQTTLPDGITVLLNYSPKTHAIFGNTKEIKDKLMALNETGKKLVSYNANLFYGPGWIIMDPKRLSEVTDMFEENDIAYTQVEKDDSQSGKLVLKTESKKVEKPVTKKAVGKATKKVTEDVEEADDEDNEVDYSTMSLQQLKTLLKERILPVTGKKDELVERLKGNSTEDTEEPKEEKSPKKVTSKTSSKTSKTPPKTKTTTKPTPKAKAKKTEDSIKGKPLPKSKNANAGKAKSATLNSFGNHEDEDTCFIFHQLPIGANGSDVAVVIGVQNTESEETGIDSVTPLDDDMIEECTKHKFRHLTDETVKLVKKRDEDIYEKLVALQSRRGDGQEDE